MPARNLINRTPVLLHPAALARSNGRMEPSREALVRDLDGGLDLDRRRNYMQLIAGVLAAVGGAVVGFSSVDERSDLAAIVGAFLGFVAGIFLAGFVLMFRPLPKISVEVAISKHRNLQRRSWYWAATWALTFASGALALPWLANDDRPWAFVICIVRLCTVTGLCAFIKVRYVALDKFGKEIEGHRPKQDF
jgi:hypothetical protein